jgi:competence ComEA-like helix-hairpin-helix protein
MATAACARTFASVELRFPRRRTHDEALRSDLPIRAPVPPQVGMQLSGDDRRALGIILGLLLLASSARWLERPRPLLEDVPDLDIAALEEASRAARAGGRTAGRVAGNTAAGRTGSPGSAARGAAADVVAARSGDDRVDPNTASPEELQRLPGVGAVTAQRIIEERARGRYTSAGDLQRVKGIGPALAARLAERVSISGEAGGGGGWNAAGGGGTAAGAASRPVPGSAASPGPAGALDLNAATLAELQSLPGVGPVLAARLVARRDSLGRFREWSEVDAVPGVGPAMLARLKQLATLGR